MLFSLRSSFAILLTAGGCLAQSAPPAAGARAMFFGGFDTPAAVAAPKKTAVAKAAGPAATATKPTATAAKKAAPPVVVATKPEPTQRPSKPTVSVINAGRVPLGLRYAILREDGMKGVEVAPTTRFKSGDRIRLKVQTNSDGYLYIVSQGTSGAWQVVFPTKARRNGSNRMKAGEEESWNFRFEGKPGVEKLFAVLSRTPEADLESLLYDLSGVPGNDGVKRAASPAAPAGPVPTLMAGNLSVSDPLVNRLRTSYTRDLVLEEVGDAPAPAAEEKPGGERAVYVVNRTNGPDSRVVADIKLIHE